jgi:hypothetical protein
MFICYILCAEDYKDVAKLPEEQKKQYLDTAHNLAVRLTLTFI